MIYRLVREMGWPPEHWKIFAQSNSSQKNVCRKMIENAFEIGLKLKKGFTDLVILL